MQPPRGAARTRTPSRWRPAAQHVAAKEAQHTHSHTPTPRFAPLDLLN